MVKLRYKSLVVNFLIGVSGIVIGYCICSNLNAVPLLQSQNTRIAHEFYFGLNHFAYWNKLIRPVLTKTKYSLKQNNFMPHCSKYASFSLTPKLQKLYSPSY